MPSSGRTRAWKVAFDIGVVDNEFCDNQKLMAGQNPPNLARVLAVRGGLAMQ
jgi:hypothetical protein